MATLFQSFPLRIPLGVVLNQLISGGVVPLPIIPDPILVDEEDPMQEHTERNISPPAPPTPLDPVADLERYLLFAKLLPMVRGLGAPPLPIPGHRIHKNHLQIEPSAHRARFEKILPPNKGVSYEQAVSRFCSKLPSAFRPLPDGAAPSGYELTMPAGEKFNVPRPALVAPNNIHELSYSLLALPFQTMTRIMHLSFPETRDWDVTFVEYATQYNPNPLDPPITDSDLKQHNRNRNMADPDGNLWSTYIWRKRPPELNIETYYRIDPTTLTRQELLGEAKCVFIVQPPWIVGGADLKFFVKTTELRPYNTWPQTDADAAGDSAEIGQAAEGAEEPGEEQTPKPPFNSAERMWAKLWDTCVRHRCNYWVLTTYEGWVFGAFTQGFSAGQILCHLPFDSTCPSVLQCLVYHVACAMGRADNILPDYSLAPISSLLDPSALFEVENPAAVDRELFDVLEGDDGVVYKKVKVVVVPPTLPREEPLDYPDSGSEWDGMDEEPDFSSGLSQYTPDDALSAYGSEANCERPFNPICLQPRYVDPSAESVRGFPLNQHQNPLQPHWIVPIQISRLNGSETDRVLEWNEKVLQEKPRFFPPPLPPRIPSPTPSDDGRENAELFRMALLPSHDPVIHMPKNGQFFGEIVYGLPARLGNILEEDDRMDV